ncbi:hypothetical protein [Falsiruegeria mediterranea]
MNEATENLIEILEIQRDLDSKYAADIMERLTKMLENEDVYAFFHELRRHCCSFVVAMGIHLRGNRVTIRA